MRVNDKTSAVVTITYTKGTANHLNNIPLCFYPSKRPPAPPSPPNVCRICILKKKRRKNQPGIMQPLLPWRKTASLTQETPSDVMRNPYSYIQNDPIPKRRKKGKKKRSLVSRSSGYHPFPQTLIIEEHSQPQAQATPHWPYISPQTQSTSPPAQPIPSFPAWPPSYKSPHMPAPEKS